MAEMEEQCTVVQDMKTSVNRSLRAIDQEDFRDALQSLPVRWMKCIKAEGSYFEGQHLDIDPLGDHGLELVQNDSEDED